MPFALAYLQVSTREATASRSDASDTGASASAPGSGAGAEVVALAAALAPLARRASLTLRLVSHMTPAMGASTSVANAR